MIVEPIFLDIETAAGDMRWIPDAGDMAIRANLKDPDKIKAAKEKATADRIEKAALDWVTGRVVAVSVAVGHAAPESLWGSREEELLDWLSKKLATKPSEKATELPGKMVTFNGLGFDLPFLKWRYITWHMELPRPELRNLSKYTKDIIDLYMVLTEGERFERWKGGQTLDFFCRYFGIGTDPTKISGADVQALIEMDDYKQVADHCQSDVVRLQALYYRIEDAIPEVVRPW